MFRPGSIPIFQVPLSVRVTRHLDTGSWKSAEWKLLAHNLGYAVMNSIVGPGTAPVVRAWALYIFLARAVRLPNEEFRQIAPSYLKKIQLSLYALWQDTFGPENCTYNFHIVVGHLTQVLMGAQALLKARKCRPFISAPWTRRPEQDHLIPLRKELRTHEAWTGRKYI